MKFDPNDPSLQNLHFSFTPIIIQTICIFALLIAAWWLSVRCSKKAK